ncbi:MAG: hypothetical protein ABW278_00530 [Steroidobacteraceae bacterium]
MNTAPRIGRLLNLAAVVALSAPVAADGSGGVTNGTIAYALKSLYWSVYQTPNARDECPDGLNTWGPRETFKALFPQEQGQKWTIVESHLAREIEGWFPGEKPEKFPYREAGGKVAIGLNLDGTAGPNDFTSPTGEQGIDNEFFRVIGCQPNLRLPDGQMAFFNNKYIIDKHYNRTLIELTGVDDLINDPDVTVTMYRGLDPLLRDATGSGIIPGGSQRIDVKFGGRFHHVTKGRIENGVLSTVPADMTFPWTYVNGTPTVVVVRDMRFRLDLSGTGAEGLWAGYVDVDKFYDHMMMAESTHHQAYGQMSPPGFARSLFSHADGHPDPATGKMTTISAALSTTFVQVVIVHPPETTDSKGGQSQLHVQ